MKIEINFQSGEVTELVKTTVNLMIILVVWMQKVNIPVELNVQKTWLHEYFFLVLIFIVYSSRGGRN